MFTGAIEPVGVILRIRPFTPFELAQACGRCLDKVKGEPQVSLGEGQKAFTFDQVYDLDAKQVDIYTATVQPLLDSFFAGVNVTILAYGQTGSGKTYTMGTEYSKVVCPDEITEKAGMIPRIVAETFERIEQERIHGTAVSHTVKVSFLEIHKDDIRDLLDSAPKTCTLREDTSGAVLVSGLEEFVVNSSRELLECLGRGSHNRATASTCMNATSSRSHAVFTITMEKTCATSAPVSYSDNTPAGPTCGSMVALDGSTVIARLHLVDLAGSERVNRAHTEGERLKEGISINKGLLALGNVISALSGEGGVGGHVPYRDSKLTRMLQDSLGGNSKTVMIACVSPADNSFEETISTMQYANRAKNIKNKAVVNVSSSNTEIASLRSHIMALEAQLHGTAPAGGNSGGSRGEVMKVDSLCVENLEEQIQQLKTALHQMSMQSSRATQKALLLEIKCDKLRWVLQQNRVTDADFFPDESCQSVGEGVRSSLDDGDAGDTAGTFNFDVGNVVAEMGDLEGGSAPGHAAVLMKHTMQQELQSDELLMFEESLGLKEKLLEQLQEGERRMQSLNADEQEMKLMREQLEQLQSEREQLLKAATANNEGKLSELEEQLAVTKRRLQESERALRLKQDSGRRILELRNDIDNMKTIKVQLLRKIKSDADRFREWRMEQQKEVTALKRQQKQANYQMHKLQGQLDKQQVVLKRKMDEANSDKMRLKTLLQKKENVAGVKAATAAKVAAAAGGGATVREGKDEEISDGLEHWMHKELQFCVEVRRVHNLLTEHMAQRTNINKEMSLVTTQLETARIKEAEEVAKNAAGDGGGGGGNALKERLAALQNSWKARQGIKSLTAKEERIEIEMRQQTFEQNVKTCSVAIRQLQCELLEMDSSTDREQNVVLNCPHVRSLPDAEKAVRFLFCAAVKSEIRASDIAGDSCQGEERAAELQSQVEALERQLRETRKTQETFQKEVLKHEQDSQEQTLHLLSIMMSGAMVDNASYSSTMASGGALSTATAITSAEKGVGGGGGGGGTGGVEAFQTSMRKQLKFLQDEMDRWSADADERKELARMKEAAHKALVEKDAALERGRCVSRLEIAQPPKSCKGHLQEALIDQVLLETRKCTVHTHMQGDSVVALEENAKEFEMMRTAVTAKLILKSNTNNDFEEANFALDDKEAPSMEVNLEKETSQDVETHLESLIVQSEVFITASRVDSRVACRSNVQLLALQQKMTQLQKESVNMDKKTDRFRTQNMGKINEIVGAIKATKKEVETQKDQISLKVRQQDHSHVRQCINVLDSALMIRRKVGIANDVIKVSNAHDYFRGGLKSSAVAILELLKDHHDSLEEFTKSLDCLQQVMDLCDEYLPQPKDAGFDEHIITPFVAGHQQRLVDYQVRYGGGGRGGGRG